VGLGYPERKITGRTRTSSKAAMLIQVGLSDMYEHLRHLVPDPEAELVSVEASGDSRFDSSMPVQSRGEAANYGEAEARDSGFPRGNFHTFYL
jgi:hypothetical protein